MSEDPEEIDFQNVKVIFPNGDIKKYPKPLVLHKLLDHPSLLDPKLISLMVKGEVKSLNTALNFVLQKYLLYY